MISGYVMTEHNCNAKTTVEDSVGMGAYNMDSHNVQRFVDEQGNVKNEGDIQEAVKPYPISYRSIVPKQGECENLIVPVCLSATHIAYGSIRMEPVFMVLGQSAATAACFSIDDQCPVQMVDYPKLRQQLRADGQVLEHSERTDSKATTKQESPAPPELTKPGEAIARLAKDLPSIETIISNAWVLDWMSKVRELPTVSPATRMVNGKEVQVDETLVYYGRYGSPLAYARALDLAVSVGFEGNAGSRVFDFGYGSIGHLRMLALAGQHAVGVDVSPLLTAMHGQAREPFGMGSVQVFEGRFPKDQKLVEKVGKDFDLVVSKNVLKKGYIHPTREVSDSRTLIDLGVDDETFLANVNQMMKPEGLFVTYNLCPPKATLDQAYVPWAEGESPFSKEQFIAAGFEVVRYNVEDNSEARRLGNALGWDSEGGMNLETDLFAWYTIVRKVSEIESERR